MGRTPRKPKNPDAPGTPSGKGTVRGPRATASSSQRLEKAADALAIGSQAGFPADTLKKSFDSLVAEHGLDSVTAALEKRQVPYQQYLPQPAAAPTTQDAPPVTSVDNSMPAVPAAMREAAPSAPPSLEEIIRTLLESGQFEADTIPTMGRARMIEEYNRLVSDDARIPVAGEAPATAATPEPAATEAVDAAVEEQATQAPTPAPEAAQPVARTAADLTEEERASLLDFEFTDDEIAQLQGVALEETVADTLEQFRAKNPAVAVPETAPAPADAVATADATPAAPGQPMDYGKMVRDLLDAGYSIPEIQEFDPGTLERAARFAAMGGRKPANPLLGLADTPPDEPAVASGWSPTRRQGFGAWDLEGEAMPAPAPPQSPVAGLADFPVRMDGQGSALVMSLPDYPPALPPQRPATAMPSPSLEDIASKNIQMVLPGESALRPPAPAMLRPSGAIDVTALPGPQAATPGGGPVTPQPQVTSRPSLLNLPKMNKPTVYGAETVYKNLPSILANTVAGAGVLGAGYSLMKAMAGKPVEDKTDELMERARLELMRPDIDLRPDSHLGRPAMRP